MFIYNLSSSCIRYFITITNSSPEFIYFYIMYYPFYIFVLQDHRPSDQTTWCSDFSTDQLVKPLGSWTSLLTS